MAIEYGLLAFIVTGFTGIGERLFDFLKTVIHTSPTTVVMIVAFAVVLYVVFFRTH